MKDLTIEEYFNLKMIDQYAYDTIYSAYKLKDTFAGKGQRLNDLTYNEMKTLFSLISDFSAKTTIVRIYCIFFDIEEQEFYKQKASDFYAAAKFVRSSIESVMMREAKLLKRSENKNTEKWKAATGNTLDPYKNLLPLIKIGKEFGMFPHDLGSRKYSEILTILAAMTKTEEAELRFNEMK